MWLSWGLTSGLSDAKAGAPSITSPLIGFKQHTHFSEEDTEARRGKFLAQGHAVLSPFYALSSSQTGNAQEGDKVKIGS